MRRCCCYRTPPVHDAACPHTHTHTSLSPPECTPVWYVLFAAPVALVSSAAAVVVGRVKLCTFSPLSLVGVHWSMFYGSNTCFFFICPSLLCSPLSAAIILPRRRFVVIVVVVYSPPSLEHRHRMRISLHRRRRKRHKR